MSKKVCSFFIDRQLSAAIRGEAKASGLSQGEVISKAFDATFGMKSDTLRLDYLLRNRLVLLPFRDSDRMVDARTAIDEAVFNKDYGLKTTTPNGSSSRRTLLWGEEE